MIDLLIDGIHAGSDKMVARFGSQLGLLWPFWLKLGILHHRGDVQRSGEPDWGRDRARSVAAVSVLSRGIHLPSGPLPRVQLPQGEEGGAHIIREHSVLGTAHCKGPALPTEAATSQLGFLQLPGSSIETGHQERQHTAQAKSSHSRGPFARGLRHSRWTQQKRSWQP